MLRSFVVKIVLVLAVVALALFGLSRVDSTKAPKHVEKTVPDNALAK